MKIIIFEEHTQRTVHKHYNGNKKRKRINLFKSEVNHFVCLHFYVYLRL